MAYNLDIPGQISAFELRAIELLSQLVPENGTVVEIGSLFGRSSWAWAKSVDPSVMVHCIDPWEGNPGVLPIEKQFGIKYGLEAFLEYTADCPNIRAHKAYSPDGFLGWDQQIDLFFEDAVHTNPIQRRNLEFWFAHLKPDGVLCGHDYRPRFPDVLNNVSHFAETSQRSLITVDFVWILLPARSIHPRFDQIRSELLALMDEARSDKAHLPVRVLLEGIDFNQPLLKSESYSAEFSMTNRMPDPISPLGDADVFEWELQLVPEGATEPIFTRRYEFEEKPLLPDIVAKQKFSLPVNEWEPGNYKLGFQLLSGFKQSRVTYSIVVTDLARK